MSISHSVTTMLFLAATVFAQGALASIADNLAYNSPSFRVPSLGHDRRAVQHQHKRWEYYDGQVSFPYGVASGDPCTSSSHRCLTLYPLLTP